MKRPVKLIYNLCVIRAISSYNLQHLLWKTEHAYDCLVCYDVESVEL